MKTMICLAACLAPLIAGRAEDWPQWLGPQRDAVWREEGILDRIPPQGLKPAWRTPIGPGYSGPAVSRGRVFVTDRRQTAPNPADPFQQSVIPGSERVLCLDAATGRILWEHEYDCPYTVSYPSGPRATPLADGDFVYTLGTEGHLFCLDQETGRTVWMKDFKKAFGIAAPLWGFSASPLVDGEKLICLAGGPGSTVVAFDKRTGRELWRSLSAKEPGYAPPVIGTFAGKRQVIVWTPEAVHGLDPETGKESWSYPFEARTGLSIATPRQAGSRLYVSSFYTGSLMLQFEGEKPSLLWKSKKASERDTEALHALMTTPFLLEGHLYGICSYGQLRCVNASTGERVWESLAATGGKEERWATAFLVRHQDRFFLFNDQGELILARLTPERYEELGRAALLQPMNRVAGREVVWSHPAFANRSIYARNDAEIVAVSLAR